MYKSFVVIDNKCDSVQEEEQQLERQEFPSADINAVFLRKD